MSEDAYREVYPIFNSGGTPVGEFQKAHFQSDLDSEPGAQHHTIGEGPNQAASGKRFKDLNAKVDANVDISFQSFPFSLNWVDNGGVWAPCSAHKIGRRVYFEGIARAAAGAGTDLADLSGWPASWLPIAGGANNQQSWLVGSSINNLIVVYNNVSKKLTLGTAPVTGTVVSLGVIGWRVL